MITLSYCRVPETGRRADSRTAHRLLCWAAERRWPELGPAPALAKGENGKPYFPEFPDCHFNLSHSGDWAVCALSDAPVGIDLQEARASSPAARRFTAREQDWLKGQPEGGFTALWVKKEAYLKCIGAGLTRPLDSFSVLPLAENHPEGGVVNRLVSFPIDRFYCAVCGRGRLDLLWHEWKGALLL